MSERTAFRLLVAACLAALPVPSRAGIVAQRAGENYVAFEGEEADSLGGGTRWRVVDLITPYAHPHANGKTPILLPSSTNASGGAAILTDFVGSGDGTVVWQVNFATAGTYRWYIRDGAFEDGNNTANYGNEDSCYRPLAFDAVPDQTYHGYSGRTEGQYGWRNTGFSYTASAPGTVDFRIGNRETGFSVDRMVFSQTTNLSSAQLDQLLNSNVAITHFTDADPGDSGWETAGNWDNGAPTANSAAFIGSGRTADLTQPGQQAYRLSIGHDDATMPGNGTLNQTGGDLTVLDQLAIGTLSAGTNAATGVYTVTGGGSLTVGTPTTGRANLYVGRITADISQHATGTLDLSGASQFTAHLDSLRIGERLTGGNGGMAQGTVVLAASNDIDAKTILVSESNMWGTIPQSKLILGASNTIKTDTFTVAGFRGNALMEFAAPGGTLDLSGSTGAAADLRIAYCSGATGTETTGVVDLRGGTFDATLDDLIIAYRVGRAEYATTSTGTLSFDAGTVTANHVTVGDGTVGPDGDDGRGIGTLNMGGGTFTVNGDIGLGTGTATSSGTIVMTGGTMTVNGNVAGGVGVSTVRVDGGTMDVTGDLKVDTVRVGYDGRAGTLTAGGDVEIGASGILDVGRRSSGGSATTTGVLDLSSASSVTLDLDELRVGTVGGDTSGNTYGTLTLSTAGPSVVDATTITLGDMRSGPTPTTLGTLHLGGNNTIRTDTFYVGRQKAQGVADIVGGGTLNLSGLSGAEADLYVGYNDTNTTSTVASGTLDLRGGTFNATLDELVVGLHGYPWNDTTNGRGTGTLSFDAGTVTANAVTIGTAGINPTYNRHGQGIGTVNVGGGALNADSIALGTGSNRSQGTLNVTGGTVAVAGGVTGGIGTSTLRVDSGTMTVGNGLSVDTLRVGYNGGTGQLTVAAGAVAIGTGSQDFWVAYKGTSGVATTRGSVDLSGASSAVINVDELGIGIGRAGGSPDNPAYGALILSPDNHITARVIYVADSTNPGLTGDTSVLGFGLANVVDADTFIVGGRKGNALATLPAGGTLEVGSAGDRTALRIGRNNHNTGTTPTATMDLSAGASFTAYLSELIMGEKTSGGSGTAKGVLLLADTNLIDVAGTILVGKGDNSGQTGSRASSITLGRMNTIFADRIILGERKTQGDLTLPGGGTLNLGSAARRADLTICLNNVNTGSTPIGTFDASGGTLNAYFGTVVVGDKSGGSGLTGSATGILHLGSNATVDMENLTLGRLSGTGRSTGTVEMHGGSLTIGSAANRGVLYVGRTIADSNQHSAGTLDLGGSATFTAWLTDFAIGERLTSGADGKSSGTVALANTNVIDATAFLVSRSEMWGSAPALSTLTLGNSNTIRADTLTVGAARGRGEMTLPAGGTLDLGGSGGAETDLRIGYNNMNTSNQAIGTLDLSGGVFNATLDELTIGFHTSKSGGAGIGTLSFAAGTVTANTMTLGDAGTHATDGDGTGTGTLNMSGGRLTAGTITLGTGTAASTGTINLSGGLLAGGSIDDGAGTANFVWTGGRVSLGTIGFALTQDAAATTLAPGYTPGSSAIVDHTPGTTVIDGDYDLLDGILEIDIAGYAQGSDCDFVDVNGDAELDSTLAVYLLAPFTPFQGDVFDILTAADITLGDDFALDQHLGITGASHFIHHVIPGGNGEILRLEYVPEPASLALLGLASLALARRRRRRA